MVVMEVTDEEMVVVQEAVRQYDPTRTLTVDVTVADPALFDAAMRKIDCAWDLRRKLEGK